MKLEVSNRFILLDGNEEDPSAIHSHYERLIKRRTRCRVQKRKSILDLLLNLVPNCLIIIMRKVGALKIIDFFKTVSPQIISFCQENGISEVLDLRYDTTKGTYSYENSFGLLMTEQRFKDIAEEAILRSGAIVKNLHINSLLGNNKFFKKNLYSFSFLRRLGIWCCSSVTEETFIDVIKNLPCLQSLHTCECMFNENMVKQLVISCPLLRDLELFCENGLEACLDFPDDDHIQVYVLWITSHLTNIESLAMRGFYLSRCDFELMLEKLPRLVRMDLGKRLVVLVQEEDIFERINTYMFSGAEGPWRRKV